MTTSPVVSVTDELIAELEAIREDASDLTPDSDAQEYLGNLAARLLAERAELKLDAQRYRWLRDKNSMPGVLASGGNGERWFNEYMLCEEKMDAAIDAAMQK